MNTDTEPMPGASVDPSHKSLASVKKCAVLVKKAAHTATTAKASLRSSRKSPGQRNRCADIAAATTLRLPSRSDATPAAVLASRSAMARPRGTRRPRPPGRRKLPGS
jgi:hypothetical protein